METGKPVSLAEAFSVIVDPRVVGRSTHELVEMLVVAVCATLCGAESFVDIELWANERLDWLRRPAGLPRDIVMRLNSETQKAIQRRDSQEWFATQGIDALGGSPEEFAARIRTDIDSMAKIIRDAGVRLN